MTPLRLVQLLAHADALVRHRRAELAAAREAFNALVAQTARYRGRR